MSNSINTKKKRFAKKYVKKLPVNIKFGQLALKLIEKNVKKIKSV